MRCVPLFHIWLCLSNSATATLDLQMPASSSRSAPPPQPATTATTTTVEGRTRFDYIRLWRKFGPSQGYWEWCNLCWKWWSDNHEGSAAHQRRLRNMEWGEPLQVQHGCLPPGTPIPEPELPMIPPPPPAMPAVWTFQAPLPVAPLQQAIFQAPLPVFQAPLQEQAIFQAPLQEHWGAFPENPLVVMLPTAAVQPQQPYFYGQGRRLEQAPPGPPGLAICGHCGRLDVAGSRVTVAGSRSPLSNSISSSSPVSDTCITIWRPPRPISVALSSNGGTPTGGSHRSRSTPSWGSSQELGYTDLQGAAPGILL